MSHSLYQTKRWKSERKVFLQEHPFCAICKKYGYLKAATVVDHIKPHKGDEVLFWDQSNWQACCKSCHDSTKQIKERSGVMPGCDAAGIPVDPDHWWNGG